MPLHRACGYVLRIPSNRWRIAASAIGRALLGALLRSLLVATRRRDPTDVVTAVDSERVSQPDRVRGPSAPLTRTQASEILVCANLCYTKRVMSLLDEARAVRARVAARLRELEPLVTEYNELQKLAAEMGLHEHESVPDAATPDELPAEPAEVPRRPPGAGSQGRAAAVPESGGASDLIAARVLEAVRAHPGKTVAEYAALLEVAPGTLYRPVRELTTEGAIVKRARQLFAA
jgi:hypothetical protein